MTQPVYGSQTGSINTVSPDKDRKSKTADAFETKVRKVYEAAKYHDLFIHQRYLLLNITPLSIAPLVHRHPSLVVLFFVAGLLNIKYWHKIKAKKGSLTYESAHNILIHSAGDIKLHSKSASFLKQCQNEDEDPVYHLQKNFLERFFDYSSLFISISHAIDFGLALVAKNLAEHPKTGLLCECMGICISLLLSRYKAAYIDRDNRQKTRLRNILSQSNCIDDKYKPHVKPLRINTLLIPLVGLFCLTIYCQISSISLSVIASTCLGIAIGYPIYTIIEQSTSSLKARLYTCFTTLAALKTLIFTSKSVLYKIVLQTAEESLHIAPNHLRCACTVFSALMIYLYDSMMFKEHLDHIKIISIAHTAVSQTQSQSLQKPAISQDIYGADTAETNSANGVNFKINQGNPNEPGKR